MTDAEYRQIVASMSTHGPILPDFSAGPAATDTINLTAKSFSFSPAQFTVTQGDNVVINFNVPSNDPASAHGLLMDTYVDPGRNCNRGQTIQITFTATTPGTFAFVCNVPSCGSGHSNMFGQMVVNAAPPNPAPAITSIAPSSGSIGGGTSVTITGTNFSTGATVTFGGTAASSVNVTSTTSITAVTPAASATGTVAVKVTNADGQSATFTGFIYTPAPPSITSVSPNSGPTSGNTAITISGSGFQSGATVTIGGLPVRAVTVVNGNTINAITGLGPATQQATQPQDVVVHNPDGSTITRSGGFTWSVPPVSVALVAPNSGLPAGGGKVLITGAGFTTGVQTSVTFGGVPATSVTVADPITLVAVTPPHAAGTVDVTVTVGTTTKTVANGFIYQVPPPRHRAVGK